MCMQRNAKFGCQLIFCGTEGNQRQPWNVGCIQSPSKKSSRTIARTLAAFTVSTALMVTAASARASIWVPSDLHYGEVCFSLFYIWMSNEQFRWNRRGEGENYNFWTTDFIPGLLHVIFNRRHSNTWKVNSIEFSVNQNICYFSH
jgi:hypothetical protein